MNIVANWLELVRSTYPSPALIIEEADNIYQQIERGLKKTETGADSVECLLLVYPHLLGQTDIKRWARLTKDALKVSRRLEAQEPLEKFATSMREIYVLPPQERVQRPTQRRRRERLNPHEMFETYINLLVSRKQFLAGPHMVERVEGVLKFARTINSPYHSHKIFQTLAFLYNQIGDYDRAIDCARLTIPYWKRREDRLEEGLASYTIAAAHRGKGDIMMAIRWLENASDLISGTTYHSQRGVIAFETGILYNDLGQHEVALQWLALAKHEMSGVGISYHLGMVYHNLGITYAVLNRLDESFEHLKRASEIWYDLDVVKNQVLVRFYTAYAQARAGMRESAQDILRNSMAQADSLPEDPFKAYLLRETRQLNKAIEKGEEIQQLQLKITA